MLKKLTILLSSAALLSAGVANGATVPQATTREGSGQLAQVNCVTEIEELPTADDEVVYVTEATACFQETGGITIAGEVYGIEYDSRSGYYYVLYNNTPWYFVSWNGRVLLTDGNEYVAIAFIE